MSEFRKIVDTMEIRNAILGSSKNEMRNAIADFWESRNEKLTYNERTGEYFLNSFFPAFPSKAWERLLESLERFQEKNDSYIS